MPKGVGYKASPKKTTSTKACSVFKAKATSHSQRSIPHHRNKHGGKKPAAKSVGAMG